MSSESTYGTFETDQAVQPSISRINLTPRRRSSRTILILICGFLFVILLAALFPFYSYFEYIWYSMRCDTTFSPRGAPKTWHDFKNQSFAIGFDLTAGYGTAAIAFDNGTIIDVARVEGTEDYNKVMARLSLVNSTHATPPYFNCKIQGDDLGRQWGRYFRKRLGQPASSDVAALASVISDLKSQTNSFLRNIGLEELELAFITAPYLPALYAEDLVDAAEFAKLQMLTFPGVVIASPGRDGAWLVSEINTAFAGNGLGLELIPSTTTTPSIINNNESEGKGDEEEKPWSDNVLFVLFTNTALTAYVGPFTSAIHFYWVSGIANFSLGLSSLPPNPSSDQLENYWDEIRLALRTALNSYLNRGNELGRVIVYGENAQNEVFDGILREEVLAAQESGEEGRRPKWYSEDPVFAASRGAAVFARWCPRMEMHSCFPDLRPRKQDW